MQQVKLKELYAACKVLMKQGHGDKYLVAPNDNEGNGYHGMFFTLSPITEENAKYYEGEIYDSVEENVTNCIVVG